RLAGVPAAALVSGPEPGLLARRAATVAARAFADAAMRRIATGARRGLGLRGGSFIASGDGPLHLHLNGTRFVTDAEVSGTGTYRIFGGNVHARLTVRIGARRIRVTLSWAQASLYARARVGRAVLRLPAP